MNKVIRNHARRDITAIALRAKGLKPPRDYQAENNALAQRSLPLRGEAKILQYWQGHYPVAQHKLMREKQREQAVGFVAGVKILEAVWREP